MIDAAQALLASSLPTPFGAEGGFTRNDRISGGSTTKSYENISYEVSSSDLVGKCSTVKGKQAGVTIDLHLISILNNGSGKACCHLLAKEDWGYGTYSRGYDGLVRLGSEDGNGTFELYCVLPVLRMIVMDASVRGGVLSGEVWVNEPLCCRRVLSSSSVRLKTELLGDARGRILTGLGERGIGVLSPELLKVSTEGEGVIVGVVGLVIAEAETFEVCGWLMPLLNGLNNHAGANLEPVLREFPDALVDSDEQDWVDIFECTEERDGEELRGTAESADDLSPPSACSSVCASRGLSSMGGMVVDPDLCMYLPPTDRYEEDRIVPLPEEA